MNEKLKIIAIIISSIVVALFVILATSYTKRLSYWMFYEDMVKQTVIEVLEESRHE